MRDRIVGDRYISHPQLLDARRQQRGPDVRHERNDGRRPVLSQLRQQPSSRRQKIEHDRNIGPRSIRLELEKAVSESLELGSDLAHPRNGNRGVQVLVGSGCPGDLQRQLAKASPSPQIHEHNAYAAVGMTA